MRCEVRSTDPRGHWRSGRRWENKFVEVDESEITDGMREDPRLEIWPLEEVAPTFKQLKRLKRGKKP